MVLKLKKSEAKVLVILNNLEHRFKYARYISFKLNMDYAYLLGVLKAMHSKKWIHKIRRENKVFYQLNKSAPIIEANQRLIE